MILLGNCLDRMKELADNSVDLVVTSPPYDDLRSYKFFGAISPESWYFEGIADGLKRVLKPGGVIVWVVGDATKNGSETGTSFRQALYFKEIGLNLHDTMIYAKNNPIPMTHNRYEQAFEYMFVFSKGRPKTFNPIKEPCKYPGGNAGRFFQKSTDNATSPAHTNKKTGPTKIIRNIWSYTVGGGKTGHPAVFPEKLAHDHIVSWSNEGDTVLDPFAGSGTTLKMAKMLNRKYIGIEISEEYIPIIEARLNAVKNIQEELL